MQKKKNLVQSSVIVRFFTASTAGSKVPIYTTRVCARTGVVLWLFTLQYWVSCVEWILFVRAVSSHFLRQPILTLLKSLLKN